MLRWITALALLIRPPAILCILMGGMYFKSLDVCLTLTRGTWWVWAGCWCTCVLLHQCGLVRWFWWAELVLGFPWYTGETSETKKPASDSTCCCSCRCYVCPGTQIHAAVMVVPVYEKKTKHSHEYLHIHGHRLSLQLIHWNIFLTKSWNCYVSV